MDPDEQYQCTQCDPGAPTEQCFPELSVCAKLSDTAVTVFGTDGVWHSSTRLDARCSPRGIQTLTHNVMGLHLSIDCKGFSSQVASIDGTTVSVYDSGGWNVQNEVVVEAAGANGVKEVFRVEIDDNTLYQSNFHSGVPVDITPPTLQCTFISLFPLYTRDKVMLWCDANTEKHIYVIDVDHDISENPPYIVSDSPPSSSPNGQTFITVSSSTLQAYRTDHLITQPSGARDFGSEILFYAYVDNNTLLLHVEGESQILVNVTTFIGSSGSEGVIYLPSASINATLQKYVASGVYATCNKTGTLFNLLLFDTSNGELMDIFPNYLEKPLDLFFQRGPLQTSTEIPTHSATASTRPVIPVTLQGTVLPTLTPMSPEQPTSRKRSNFPIFVTVAVAVSFIILVVVLLSFVLITQRMKLLSKLSCRNSNGPFVQATDDKSSDIV